MKLIKTALAAASLLAAMFVVNTPAQALKALQYRAQGHGRYLNSTGTPKHYTRNSLFARHRHHGRMHRY